MAKESNIKREIEKLLSIMPKDLEFSAKWFKKSTLNGLYGRAKRLLYSVRLLLQQEKQRNKLWKTTALFSLSWSWKV